jgi:long-chain fatty acid transport protein
MNGYVNHGMRLCKVLPLLLLVMLYPATGFSLDNGQWSTGLNFRFYPPGARALGMGGAFVGLADDATAAASNPAGIAQLTRMQLAIEGRYINTDGKENSFGFGSPIGPVRTTSNENDVTEISFGAFTTPVFNNMFNIAVFYDKPMSFSVNNAVLFPNLFSDLWNPLGAKLSQNVPSTTDISIDEVGLSIAKSFADGRFMLGVGFGAQFLDYQSRISAKTSLTDGTDTAVTARFKGQTDGNDVGLSYRVGLLAKPIDSLRLGISYTHMPKFDLNIKFHDMDFVNRLEAFSNYSTSFDVPDNFALGAAYNILPNWVAVFEAKYVMYSELMNRFAVDRFYGDRGGVLELSDSSEFRIDNVMELHFGTEYVLNVIKNVPIALRAGIFYDPAHDLEYTGTNPIERALFDGGEDVVHFTVGAGLVLFNHYQVDVGADFTDESRNVALSMVYQF